MRLARVWLVRTSTKKGMHVSVLAHINRRINRLFSLTVILPLILATLYFGFFASDVYVSESQFVVRSPEKPSASGLGVLLQTAGFSTASEEVFAAKAFAESRDALRTLDRTGAYRKAYQRPEISVFNRFDPFGFGGAFEDLFQYFTSHVRVDADSTTSISTLTVRAYTAEDAHWINRRLLEMSEATVNELNKRGQADLVRYASAEVSAAKDLAQATAVSLAEYRNRSGIVDPEKQAEIQLQMISKLQDELIASRAQLGQLQAFTPKNPQIPVLLERIALIENEIGNQAGVLAGKGKSLASSTVEFQRRMLEDQLAQKQLTASLAALEDAKKEARRQQVYVERIVSPNLPDAPLEPRRFRGILATLAIGLVAWGILSMLMAGVREHAN